LTSATWLEADVPENAKGVLHALGAVSGGLTCYVKDGVLCYEYNLFMIDRTKIRAKEKLPVGKVKIEVETKPFAPKPGSPLDVPMKVNGRSSPRAGCRSAPRRSSPRTTASTSAVTSARPCRRTTSTKRRFSSTAGATAWL
jgi:hypothetical protein